MISQQPSTVAAPRSPATRKTTTRSSSLLPDRRIWIAIATAVLCLAFALPAHAQSVWFAGAQITVPASGLSAQPVWL
jgi:hypothetical protein